MNQAEAAESLRHELGAYLRMSQARGAAAPPCLADATLAALAEGTIASAGRPAAVAHLAVCPHCRAAVAALARSLADPSLRRELARRNGRLTVWAGVAVAAAALVLMVRMPGRTPGEALAHRERSVTAASAPSPIAPVGVVDEARTLRWSPVAGADLYRVTLFDGTDVRYEARVTGAELALPDSVVLPAGRPYVWKVEARIGWDRWAASDLARFTIAGAPRP